MPFVLAVIALMSSQTSSAPQPVTRAVMRSAQALASKNGENVVVASNGDICFSLKRSSATARCAPMTLFSFEAPVKVRTSRGTIYAVQENGMGSGGIQGVLFFRSDGVLLRSVYGEAMLLGSDAGDVAIMSSVRAGASASIFVRRFSFDGWRLSQPTIVKAFPADRNPRPSYPYDQNTLSHRVANEACAVDACAAARVVDVFSSTRGAYVLLAWGCGVPTYHPFTSRLPPVGSYIFVNDKTRHWWFTTASTARADWASCG